MRLDLALLRKTVSVAESALAGGDGPFGAAVVLEGNVVSLEPNSGASTLDPTAHAEVCAIRSACLAMGRAHLGGATLYSSCEPCMMCAAAAVWAGIGTIVYAAPIDVLTRYPIAELFPPGSFSWSHLPVGRTLHPRDEAIALLSASP